MIARMAPALTAGAGAALVLVWLATGAGQELVLRVPGMDRPVGVHFASSRAATTQRVTTGTSTSRSTGLETFFAMSDGVPADLPGAWPRFRGPNGDGISVEEVPFARTWPAEGPKALWSVQCGEGYAGPAVLNGRVYLLDYDQEKRADVLRCLSLADGKEIWRRWYSVDVPKQHGSSRTVPAVTDKHVVTLGPMCHVMCVDAETGEYRWGIDLVRDYGTTVPPWYAGQCPLIDGERAILAPAGSKLMIAVNCASGKVEWETPNPNDWAMTHGSIAVMEFAGRRMYVYCASGGVVGVSAEDGAILWEFPGWTVSMANVPSPVPVGDGKIFLSGGYRAGSMMIELKQEGGRMVGRQLYRLKQEVFGCEQQTPIFYEDHIYGVLTKDAGALKEQLVCLDLTGKQLWTSGRENRFGPYGGPYLIAQGVIFVMNDDGVLSLVEAAPEEYRQLARAKVLEGKESWAPMALVGGRLLVRDLTHLACLDLRAESYGR